MSDECESENTVLIVDNALSKAFLAVALDTGSNGLVWRSNHANR